MENVYLFDEAYEICLAHARATESEVVSVFEAQGRFLAADVVAAIDVPPFRRAMMDGFAVHGDDCEVTGRPLRVIGTVAAGGAWAQSSSEVSGNSIEERDTAAQLRVEPGTAARIMTGAPVPANAKSVVRFEWCAQNEDGTITVLRSAKRGESIQPVGEDGRQGQVLLRRGTRLGPTEISVCRTFGVFSVFVSRRPTVSILVTGSELVEQPRPLQQGQIYGTNDAFLSGLLEMDGVQMRSVEYVSDNPRLIEDKLVTAAAEADYVILTGGVSAGDFDFVPDILARLGGHLALKKILLRPGSPFVLTTIGSATVFALSGNPGAAFVQFECLVRPVVQKTLGLTAPLFPASGKLRHAVELKPIKHVRVFRGHARIENGEVWIDTEMAQSSGVVSSFAHANCLVRLDANSLPAGAVVPLRWYKPLF